MPLPVYDVDYRTADDLLSKTGLPLLRSAIAHAIAEERERCAELVEGYVCSTAHLGLLVKMIRNPGPDR